MRRLIPITFVLLAALASSAAAAPPWLPPQTLSTPSLFVDSPDVVVAADGRALATWRWSGPRPATGAQPGGWRLAVREPGAVLFGTERAAPDFATPLIAYGRDRVVALDTRSRGSTPDRISLRARFGSSRGEFGPPRTISSYTQAGGPPSLAGPRGSLAAWIAASSHGRRIVRVALKSGGRFGRPVTLRRRGRATDVVAGTALGVMFVAWQRGGFVEARVRLAGRRWGPVQRLGRSVPFATQFAVVGSGRRGYVAWLAQAEESAVVRVAVLPAAGRRFRKAQTIRQACFGSEPCREDIRHVPPGDGQSLRLVPIPDRDALLAWSDWDSVQWRVKASLTAESSPTFSDAFVVSPAGQSSVLGDAAAVPPGTSVPAGTAMLVWSRLDAVGELGDRVQASVRPPRGPFGAPEDVSDLDRARIPALAFDFDANRWTTVWSQRIGPDAPGVPLAQITTFARSSTRPG